MLRDFLITASRVVQQRMMFFIALSAIVILGLLAWNIASTISSFDDNTSAVSIEPLIDDTFLGIQVEDHTHDQYINNAELRLAMNEGFKASNSIRRYQMQTIRLQDSQNSGTGEPVVLVTVEPGHGEIPSPPFEPVAVHRWEPGPKDDYPPDELREMRMVYSPNTEDLDRIRDVWSGGRSKSRKSLFGSVSWLFVFTAIGMGLLVLAGAYRSNAWRISRWDRAADVKHHDATLAKIRSARDAKRS